MAFDFKAQFIADHFKSYFPMKIYGADDDEPLPCDLVELSDTQDFSIPTEPIDKNMYITDTIYKNPRSFTAQVLVSTAVFDEFETKIHELQFSEAGITIKGLDEQVYNNLRLLSIGSAQTTEYQGAYLYELEFIQVTYVTAQTTTITTKAPVGAKPKKSKGNKAPKKEEQKCQPRSLAKMGKDWFFGEKSCKPVKK